MSNQRSFYAGFDAIVLLSAPLEVILERVASRRTNDYGKSDGERELIVDHVATVEPLLRAGATAEIDTRRALVEVADELEGIAERAAPVSRGHAAPRRLDGKECG